MLDGVQCTTVDQPSDQGIHGRTRIKHVFMKPTLAAEPPVEVERIENEG